MNDETEEAQNRSNAKVSVEGQRRLLFAQLGIVTTLATLHKIGFMYFLYWRFHWFDIITHLLGGMWVVTFAAWVQILRQRKPTLIFCVCIAFALGVVWESFEAMIGSTSFPADTLDTVKDLSVDLLGAVAGILIFKIIPRL